jgi:hypothetical protein
MRLLKVALNTTESHYDTSEWYDVDRNARLAEPH